MASISNYTATAKRTWYDGNTWHTDDVTFAQFPTTDNFSNDDLLFKTISVGDFFDGWWCYNSYYALYHPGKLYKPKKYYSTYELFFTKEQLENILESCKNLAASFSDTGVFAFINGSENSIITFKNNGYYYFCIVNASFSAATLLTDQRTFNVSFMTIKSKFLPQNFQAYYGENNTVFYKVKENGEWRAAERDEDFSILDGQFFCASYGGYPHSIQDIWLRLTEFINDFAKTKWYPLISTDNIIQWYDGYDYYKSCTTNFTSSTTYKVRFLADISGQSMTNGNYCFIIPSGYFPAKVYSNYNINLTSSPEPSKSSEDDDPNDEDPGSQGGDTGGSSDKGGDGDHDDSSDVISEDPLPEISGSSNNLITVWNLTSSQIESLASQLWSPDAWQSIKQYFTNPMESILSLAIIPVSPNTTSGTIHLGGYDTGISAKRLISDYVKFDCGSIPINRYYGSYLDYAPFTKISCTLPYIGEVDIDPDQVMQKVLSISYHINCVTGECVAYLKADDGIFATFAGNCVKQMPICQTDFSSIISGAVQIASTVITSGAVGASAGAAASGIDGANMFNSAVNGESAIAGAESLVKANSSLLGSVMSMKPSYKHSSQLGAGVGHLAFQTPFLTIIRPNLDLAEDYKSFTGYPCNKNLLLSSLHGFTQVEATNLSVPSASLDELLEIKELLLKGVII